MRKCCVCVYVLASNFGIRVGVSRSTNLRVLLVKNLLLPTPNAVKEFPKTGISTRKHLLFPWDIFNKHQL